MRFAFCGRVSTEDHQDPEASRLWQLNRAQALISSTGGTIVDEYFDIGHSRALPWKRRPRASALLTALANPDRGFGAVVIGEPQRAFYGSQFGNTFPLFVHYGVPLWVPEVGGPIDPDNEAHDLIMSVFGGMSKGERNRIKVRVHSAMSALALMEGRYLGGRPPYGYRLKDLGPHPHPAKAADGKRLYGLEPDPTTAPVVTRIFTDYLKGLGLFAVAERLTRDTIPCPSAHDRTRNPHRSGVAWSKSAVRAILTNPRYTGRNVWNRQHKHETLADIEDVTLGYATTMRWNSQDKWIVSKKIVHTPLVSDDTFARAQSILATRNRTGPAHGVKRTRNSYVLRGLIKHAACMRKMQGHWAHEEAYYRCRYAQEYALANNVSHPRNVYLRESWVLDPLDAWLTTVFKPHRLDDTIDAMAASTTPKHHTEADAARAKIADCDAKLATHRAALEAGADPTVVTQWIAETQAHRARAAAELGRTVTAQGGRMTREDIAELVRAAGELTEVIRQADPADKAEIYKQLGLRLTYDSGKHKVLVEIDLNQHSLGSRGLPVGVRGGT
ncbi:recombinase family protein [Streptomyces buecherae]|uniref:recombinase family protein n=1 Tax=Streptomyces buecherae TaxID=2763006 RepID=UPI00378F944B